MTELDREWAETQIEAMADGSLPDDAERRMRAAMREDAELRARVEQARLLRRDLRQLADVRVPKGLGRRLMRIADSGRSRSRTMLAPALASFAAIAISIGVFYAMQPPQPDPAREEALRDFAIAVAYLQKSAEMTRDHVNHAVGAGVMDAFTASQRALDQTMPELNEGDDQ